MGFPRQEHQSGLPFPSPEDLPNPGTEAMSPALAVRFFTTSATWEVIQNKKLKKKKKEFLFLGSPMVRTRYFYYRGVRSLVRELRFPQATWYGQKEKELLWWFYYVGKID